MLEIAMRVFRTKWPTRNVEPFNLHPSQFHFVHFGKKRISFPGPMAEEDWRKRAEKSEKNDKLSERISFNDSCGSGAIYDWPKGEDSHNWENVTFMTWCSRESLSKAAKHGGELQSKPKQADFHAWLGWNSPPKKKKRVKEKNSSQRWREKEK